MAYLTELVEAAREVKDFGRCTSSRLLQRWVFHVVSHMDTARVCPAFAPWPAWPGRATFPTLELRRRCPVSVLHFHGTADGVILFVADALGTWSEVDSLETG